MALLMGMALWVAPAPSQAATVTYSLDYIFSPPTGSGTPLATVTLTDVDTAVRFDVTNRAGAGTRLDSLYFNFAQGAINPNQLTFSDVSAAPGSYGTLLALSTSATVAGLKADGDGYFDGKISYNTNNYLGHGETLSFRLSSAGQDLSVNDFHFFSLPGGGTGSYIMASHIQNMPYPGNSLWVGTVAAVPLPGALLLFGTGLGGFMLARTSKMLA